MKIKFVESVPPVVRSIAMIWVKNADRNRPAYRAIHALEHEHMDRIWINLQTHEPVGTAKAFINENFGSLLFFCGVHLASEAEKAYAALFCMCLTIAAEGESITDDKCHARRVETYKQAADVVKETMNEAPNLDFECDDITFAALDLARCYLIRRANALLQDHDPARLPTLRGNDNRIRSAARRFIHLNTSIFGCPLHDIAAGFLSAIFAPKDISEEKTKSLCRN